jgi:hypothetical protein
MWGRSSVGEADDTDWRGHRPKLQPPKTARRADSNYSKGRGMPQPAGLATVLLSIGTTGEPRHLDYPSCQHAAIKKHAIMCPGAGVANHDLKLIGLVKSSAALRLHPSWIAPRESRPMRKFCPSCGEVRECHRIASQDVHGDEDSQPFADEINVYECPCGHTFTKAERVEEAGSALHGLGV